MTQPNTYSDGAGLCGGADPVCKTRFFPMDTIDALSVTCIGILDYGS